jgi:hypothetical protein
MVGMRAALLLLFACTPSDRTVAHALLDEGLDSVVVLGWAPSCAPARGAYFEARAPVRGETVTGVVCCDRRRCDVVFTSP